MFFNPLQWSIRVDPNKIYIIDYIFYYVQENY